MIFDGLFCLLYFVLQTVYSAVTFPGYVGVMTGQRPHAFTLCKEMKILIVCFVYCILYCRLYTVL